MGYKAFGDEKYEALIDSLFKYCSENRVPLFTHCTNQGFEAYPDSEPPSGYCANPKYWEKALEKYNDLILCLGHAGGTNGWFCENRATDRVKADEINSADIVDESEKQEENWNHSYAALVFKLCVKYDHVYCDASYLDEMVKANGSFEAVAKKNFKTRLRSHFRR